MSNLLKSKFLLGVMVVVIGFIGVVALATPVAADCSITSTLRLGSKGAQVVCLQTSLGGLTADGSFGPKTLAGVKAWQANAGLVADGIFGAKSRAAFTSSTVTTTYPAGCTSASGYSPTTGAPCTGVVTTTYPAGCTSAAGYSSTTGASCSTGVVSSATGPVSVALASDTPASGYIIGSQATADLAHFAFSGVGTVNTVVLQRTGVSDQNTLSSVYLYDGATHLTDGYSFNNTGQLTMNSLAIAVNGSKVISVKADVASGATASSLGITLVGFTAAGQSATTVSIKGNEMTYGTGSLATVYLPTQASTYPPAASASVNAGTSGYTVWSAPVNISTRAVWLKGANFRMTGSAPADSLGNIKLFVDGVVAGTAATVGTISGSSYAMFDFSAAPISLSTGGHTVEVRADIVKGASYKVTISLQQAADLVVYDAQVGVNIAPAVGSSTAFSSNTANEFTISAGSASVVVDPTFGAMTNVTGGATNVVLGKFKIHGYGEDVKVSTLSVLPLLAGCYTSAGAITCDGINNLTVYFNGSQVGSSWNWVTGAGAHSFTLGSQMILPAGTDSYVEIRGDLQTHTDSANYTAGTVTVTLKGVTGNSQGQNSKSTLSFPGATGVDVATSGLTIQTGVLAVSKNTGYASQNVNPNTTGVKVGSFVLQNQSSSESVRATSLAISLFDASLTALSADTTPKLTNFLNLRTSETSGSGATPIQPSASNTFSVDFTLAPGATKVIDILSDTGSDSSGSIITKLVVTSLGASSNVSISQNGNAAVVVGQTITMAVGAVDNTIALLTAPSTAQQFVPAATTGATNATKATFKITSTGGSARITEMKFTVNSQDVSSASTDTDLASTGQKSAVTVASALDAAKFKVGDVVQLVGAVSNGVGTIYAVTADSADLGINVTVPMVGATATPTVPTAVRLVPATVTAISVGGVSAAPVSGVAYLTGLSLTVPSGGSGLSQDVYVSYAEVGTNGIQSGATSRISLAYMKYVVGSTTKTLGTSVVCNATLSTTCTATQTANTVSAPTMKMVGSAPTLSLTSSTSTLIVGSVDIGSVTVTANAKGDITLNTLPISVTLTNATMGNANPGYAVNGIRVTDKDGNTVTTTNTVFGSTTAGGTSTITFTGGYPISAGTSQVFHIKITTNAVDNTAGAHTSAASLTLGTADLLSWTDTAGNAAAATGTDEAVVGTATGGAAYTASNRWLYTTDFPTPNTTGVGAGFLYSYPANTVSVSS